MMGMAVASAGPYANNLHTNTSSVYTGRMLFLTPNRVKALKALLITLLVIIL